MGVAEDAEPIEFGLLDEVFEDGDVVRGFAGETDDEGGAEGNAGDGFANLLQGLEEDVRTGAALHGFEHRGRGVLEGDVEIFADVVVLCDGFEELVGDAVGIGVEEAEPAEVGDSGELVEERGQAVFEAEVLAVAGGVLTDEGDLLDAAGDEGLSFCDYGFEAAGTELSAEVGDDAEGAGVVASLGDFDVGGRARGG